MRVLRLHIVVFSKVSGWHFLCPVLFTDEVFFTREEVFYTRSTLTDQVPHDVAFLLMCGRNSGLIGRPIRLQPRMNGHAYFIFDEDVLPKLLIVTLLAKCGFIVIWLYLIVEFPYMTIWTGIVQRSGR
ncbi:hypothetical protein TNCV_841851 [Trichonephila clavipes]|nr:hypothetical protein TNCV_841851 [Trichonephila clavipes]